MQTYPLICLKRASFYCAIRRKSFPVTLMVGSECVQQSLHRFPAICRYALCYGSVNFFSKKKSFLSCYLFHFCQLFKSENRCGNSHGTSIVKIRNWIENHKVKVLLGSSSARWCPGVTLFPDEDRTGEFFFFWNHKKFDKNSVTALSCCTKKPHCRRHLPLKELY